MNDENISHQNKILWDAVAVSNVETIEHVLKNGANVNYVNPNGRPVLVQAVYIGNLEVIKILLKVDGIDVNCVGNNYITPLIMATWTKNSAAINLLRGAKGMIVNKAIVGYSALHRAARWGFTNETKALLDFQGIKATMTTPYGNTPLHLAIQRGHIEIIELFLRNKSVLTHDDFFIENNKGKSPLKLAEAYMIAKPNNKNHELIYERLMTAIDSFIKGVHPASFYQPFIQQKFSDSVIKNNEIELAR